MPAQKQRSNETPEEDLLTTVDNNNEVPVDEFESDRNHSSSNGDKKEYVEFNPLCTFLLRFSSI
ncbi:hypothetical protein TanjilG_31147 [Lupinus angustifolius]|uniref:Uncharacterized protein n=1 Tax=Lupinus angustifolius TaxID=3871 RepID=A0A1J7GRH2_LUPAN|nr:hypothetical protein TanjilG_31147 [Lupinus angustifolius]